MDKCSKSVTQGLTVPCALCGVDYTSTVTTSYALPGLCNACFSKDVYRELDRVISAARHAERAGRPATLTLSEWLSVVNSFSGKCALCQLSWYSEISIWLPDRGLVSGNVVPLCKACSWHKEHSFLTAMQRVGSFLNGNQVVDITT